LPLRTVIPAALLIFTAVVGAWAYLATTRFSSRTETQAAVGALTRDTTTLQRTLEYLFANDALAEVQQELAERGAYAEIEAAVVVDEQLRVLAAADRSLLGQHLDQHLDELALRRRGVDPTPALREALDRLRGQVLTGTDGNLIVAVYPVVLGTAPGQLRANRLGALVIAREVVSAKAQGRREMARLTGMIVFPVALFAVLLLVGAHFVVTRRVTALVRAARRFATGDMSVRAGLTGQDEVAQVGEAFDDMVGQVAAAQRNLAESEERLRLVVSGTHDGIWDWNLHTHEAYLAPRWKEILGYRNDELPNIDSSFFDRVHPDDKAAVESAVVRHLEHREPYAVEFRLRHKDGSYRWVLSRGEAVREEDGRAVRMLGSITDFTERKRAEQSIREQARLLDLIFQYSVDSIVLLDKDYNFIRVSHAYANACQRSVAEFLGRNHFALYPSSLQDEVEEYRKTKTIYSRSSRPFIFPDHPEWGTTYWDLGLVPILDPAGEIEFFLFTLKDVTQRVRAEQQVKASLREKEVLLKEVHHRVKNNMQVISSLMYLQSQKVTDPRLIAAFQESENRVAAMALVHEQLYRTPNLARLDFSAYTRSLAQSLVQSYGVDASRIELLIEMADLRLDVGTAIPCGLILNELMSNAFKHAFPDGRSGRIEVRLHRDGTRCRLDVRDDGVGLPLDGTAYRPGSLGLRLIERLVAQLQGALERSGPPGTRYVITFPTDQTEGP
jgi:PAS domain S-box-containing protein